MLKPARQDDSFLSDVAAAGTDRENLHLWWLGQSGFLVQWQGRHLLLDPYLSDSLTQKYASTDKPHVRMMERVIAPEKLNFVDVVTSSHNHTDHLDADTLLPLLGANPDLRMVIPEANRAFVVDRLRSGVSPTGLAAGEKKEVAGFVFYGIPSAHNQREQDSSGLDKFMGYVIECGPWKIYHAGDTKLFEGMEDLLRPFAVDVALLPINGDRPERRVAGNLDGSEAARLAQAIQARLAIPCHYDMFEFNTASPEEFITECRRLGQPCKILRQGERWSSGAFRERLNRS